MLRRFLISTLLIISPTLWAEDLVHEVVLKAKYGYNQTLDPYLSPLRYDGWQVGFGCEWWQPFRHTELGSSSCSWWHEGQVDIVGQRAYSSARTNRYYGLGAHAGWGAFARWKYVFVGPYLDVDLLVREHASEINKPYSADVAMDAMVLAGAEWCSSHFEGEKAGVRLRYMFRMNLLGAQFHPDYWQGYYEMYVTRLHGAIHPSGPWNRNRIWHELTLDISGKHTTWRLGAEHEWLRYGSREMTWNRHQVNLIVAAVWKYKNVRR